MKRQNLILLADAYKYSHHKLYYPGTTNVYSYLESRGGKFDQTVFFGLQYILKEYLEGTVITTEDIDEAEKFLTEVFGRTDVFDRSRFDYIVERHGGRLPIRIKAVPEGSKVPVHNVLMTLENTDPKCFWLTNFLETLLMQVWYPATVATLSHEVRQVVEKAFTETADEESKGAIPFVLNDFGFRGVSSVESAGIGGAAHLLNFSGSDTLAGSRLIQQYYNSTQVYGKSVPATEHSICTLLGEEGELDIFRHVLNTFPEGIVACVSDSYNILRACESYWGEALKQQVLNRKGTLVIRPDSGDPVTTLLAVFEILFQQFGYTTNSKGYKVLPPQVRVIQGDGVNYDSICEIYQTLKEAQISAENLVLGMGGALLQKVDRDTQKFALKCSWARVKGHEVDVQKSPMELNKQGVLQPSFKKSKRGRLKLVEMDGQYRTVAENDYSAYADQLVTVFQDGELLKEYGFEEIKERLNQEVVLI